MEYKISTHQITHNLSVKLSAKSNKYIVQKVKRGFTDFFCK